MIVSHFIITVSLYTECRLHGAPLISNQPLDDDDDCQDSEWPAVQSQQTLLLSPHDISARTHDACRDSRCNTLNLSPFTSRIIILGVVSHLSVLSSLKYL